MSRHGIAFRLLGFPVQVEVAFFLVTAVLGWPARFDTAGWLSLATWIVVVTFSILAHELGHALAMRRFGFMASIELGMMGGLTRWGRDARPTPGQRVAVSLAGPFAGFVVGGVVYVTSLVLPAPHPAWADALVYQLLWVNVGWGLANLLPMLPWDGGNALLATLDHMTGGRGARPAAIVTLVVSTLAIAAALYVKSIWGVCLAAISWRDGLKLVRARPRPKKPVDPRSVLQSVGGIATCLSGIALKERRGPIAGPFERVEPSLRDLDGTARSDAAEALAWLALGRGDPLLAKSAAAAIEEGPPTVLRGTLLVADDRLDEAIALLETDSSPAAVAALGLALARGGRSADALALLTDESLDRMVHHVIGAALFRARAFDEAATATTCAFERFGNPSDAYNAACSHAQAGRTALAFEWLGRAVDAGLSNDELIDEDPDLEPVRALPGYPALRARVGTASRTRA